MPVLYFQTQNKRWLAKVIHHLLNGAHFSLSHTVLYIKFDKNIWAELRLFMFQLDSGDFLFLYTCLIPISFASRISLGPLCVFDLAFGFVFLQGFIKHSANLSCTCVKLARNICFSQAFREGLMCSRSLCEFLSPPQAELVCVSVRWVCVCESSMCVIIHVLTASPLSLPHSRERRVACASTDSRMYRSHSTI